MKKKLLLRKEKKKMGKKSSNFLFQMIFLIFRELSTFDSLKKMKRNDDISIDDNFQLKLEKDKERDKRKKKS